jgi:hypothetical protein
MEMTMPMPLMPKATAVWLVENTGLTFEQIGDFCGLHKLEVQAIADGEVAMGIIGLDPVLSGQLTAEEIKRCEDDTRAKLKMVRSDLPQPATRTKGPRYTPVAKRADKPDAIAYLVKTYPELLDAQIARLLGTTKDTIVKVREHKHWNAPNIKPKNPVLLGLCKQTDLDAALKRARRRIERERKAQGLPPEDTMTPVTADAFVADEPEAEENSFVSFDTSSNDEQPIIDPNSIFKPME